MPGSDGLNILRSSGHVATKGGGGCRKGWQEGRGRRNRGVGGRGGVGGGERKAEKKG